MEGISENSVVQISQVFPGVDVNVIRTDLSFTLCPERTINRILDGTVIQSSPEKNTEAGYTCSSTDNNSDSDLDLPILKPKVYPINLKPIVTDVPSGLKHESKNTVIDLSKEEDEDLSDTDVNTDSDSELPDLDIKCNNHCPDGNQIDLTTDGHEHKNTDNCDTESGSVNSHLEVTSVSSNSQESNPCRKTTGQVDVNMSDSEDSDTNESLANRLGLAERCGFGVKAGFLSKLTSGSSEQCGPAPVCDKDNVNNDDEYTAPQSKGKKRKSKTIHSENEHITSAQSTASGEAPAKKAKKKRTAEEIAECKRQAEEKRTERLRAQVEKRAQKQQESEMKKAIQENKRHFRPGNCVKYVTVSVDPGVINNGQLGAGIFKVCEDLGTKCVTETQLTPNTITWKREILDCNQPTAVKQDVVEDDVLTMIPIQDFICMVLNYVQNQNGLRQPDALTVKEYIQTLQSVYSGKTVAVFVMGKEKYFSDQKLSNKRNHREAVLNVAGRETQSKKKSKKGGTDPFVTRIQMEEALIDAQLHTCCIVQFAETSQEASDLIKCFTKAVADKPAKKDRLENVFDFLAEGAAGVKVDKNGNGLLKVWKHQLLQFKSVGPDMAEAIIAAYPSPRLLHQAYKKCSTEKEAQKLLENIVVRRGAGVLVTNRRIGKELSRRIYSLFTCTDPNFVIK